MIDQNHYRNLAVRVNGEHRAIFPQKVTLADAVPYSVLFVHIKGQTPLQFDSPIKQLNGFRNSQPLLGKNVFHLALEARFDAGANRRALLMALQ